MRTDYGLVDGTQDVSLKDFQNCQASSGPQIEVIEYLGFSKEVVVNGKLIQTGTCPADIIWFNSKEHFEMTALPDGKYDFGREDVENNASIKTTVSGQTTINKAFTIKGTENSEYIQHWQNIMQNDMLYGLNTELLKAYSNGGLHLKRVRYNPMTGVTITTYALNVKIGELMDLLQGFDNESEFAIDFLVEYGELIQIDTETGSFSDAFGLPEGSLEMTGATATATATSVTLSYGTLTATGVNPALGAVECYAAVVNLKNGATIGSIAVGSPAGSALNITGLAEVGDELKVNFFFKFGKQLLIAGETVNVTVAAAI